MKILRVNTESKKEVVDLTEQIRRAAAEADETTGLCHLFLLHTTAALTTADLDPGTDLDLLDALTAIVPDLDYRHPHNPEHAPDHILGSLIGPSLWVPIEEGEPLLGTWQRIVLIEFDGPRRREIVFSIIGER